MLSLDLQASQLPETTARQKQANYVVHARKELALCVSSKFKTKQLRTRMIRNVLFTRQVRVSRFCVSFSFLPPLPRPSPPLCFLSQQAGYSKLAISLRLTRLSRACRLSEPCPTLNIITSLQSLWALPRPEMQDKISARM